VFRNNEDIVDAKDNYAKRVAPFLASPIVGCEVKILVGVRRDAVKSGWMIHEDDLKGISDVLEGVETFDVKSDSRGLFEAEVIIESSGYKSENFVYVNATILGEKEINEHFLSAIIPQNGISIISDVDDTIKDSSVYISKFAAITEYVYFII
jgi:phosphatidate phosphatase APP1